MVQEIVQKYTELFGGQPLVVRAPGRINIIGEHTDYNEGYVMPAAIDKYLYFALGENPDEHQIRLYAFDFQEPVTFDLHDFSTEKKVSWKSYLKAVVTELLLRSYPLRGFQGVFGGDIPLGAGLSSSAALCCGLVYGISKMQNLSIPKKEIALIAQATEHRIGLNCGLMDQYASLFGKKDRAFRLDCKTLKYHFLQINLRHHAFVLIHSNIKHELAAGSGYNDRRRSCETVVSAVQKIKPSVRSLRDVDGPTMASIQSQVSETDYRRAAYVLAENLRVMAVSDALQREDFEAAGEILFEAHDGLRYQYEVTVPETDLLVELGKQEKTVLGARQVGGGFGGCVLFLMKKENLEATLDRMTTAYRAQTGIEPTVIPVSTGDGVSLLKMRLTADLPA